MFCELWSTLHVISENTHCSYSKEKLLGTVVICENNSEDQSRGGKNYYVKNFKYINYFFLLLIFLAQKYFYVYGIFLKISSKLCNRVFYSRLSYKPHDFIVNIASE